MPQRSHAENAEIVQNRLLKKYGLELDVSGEVNRVNLFPQTPDLTVAKFRRYLGGRHGRAEIRLPDGSRPSGRMKCSTLIKRYGNASAKAEVKHNEKTRVKFARPTRVNLVMGEFAKGFTNELAKLKDMGMEGLFENLAEVVKNKELLHVPEGLGEQLATELIIAFEAYSKRLRTLERGSSSLQSCSSAPIHNN